MKTCCICGTGWKTEKEDKVIYGCRHCNQGNSSKNMESIPRFTESGKSPYLRGEVLINKINEKLKVFGSALVWKIK